MLSRDGSTWLIFEKIRQNISKQANQFIECTLSNRNRSLKIILMLKCGFALQKLVLTHFNCNWFPNRFLEIFGSFSFSLLPTVTITSNCASAYLTAKRFPKVHSNNQLHCRRQVYFVNAKMNLNEDVLNTNRAQNRARLNKTAFNRRNHKFGKYLPRRSIEIFAHFAFSSKTCTAKTAQKTSEKFDYVID